LPANVAKKPLPGEGLKSVHKGLLYDYVKYNDL